MESFLLKYFRNKAKTSSIIGRLLLEVVFFIYVAILYIPLKVLEGLRWFIKTGADIRD